MNVYKSHDELLSLYLKALGMSYEEFVDFVDGMSVDEMIELQISFQKFVRKEGIDL